MKLKSDKRRRSRKARRALTQGHMHFGLGNIFALKGLMFNNCLSFLKQNFKFSFGSKVINKEKLSAILRCSRKLERKLFIRFLCPLLDTFLVVTVASNTCITFGMVYWLDTSKVYKIWIEKLR